VNFGKDYELKKAFRVRVILRQSFGDSKPMSGDKTPKAEPRTGA
jgi:hypothetical protein